MSAAGNSSGGVGAGSIGKFSYVRSCDLKFHIKVKV